MATQEGSGIKRTTDHLFAPLGAQGFGNIFIREETFKGKPTADTLGRVVVVMCGNCGDIHEHTVGQIIDDPNLIVLRRMLDHIPSTATVRIETDPSTVELMEQLRGLIE